MIDRLIKMNRSISKLSVVALAAVTAMTCVVSCNRDDKDNIEPALSVTPLVTDIVFTAEGNIVLTGNVTTHIFTVMTNQDSWNVEVEPHNLWLYAIRYSDYFVLSGAQNSSPTETPSATVTIRAGNATPVVINATQQPANAIAVSRTTAYEFPSGNEGGYTATPLEVTVSNAGSMETGALIVALSGNNAGDFILSATTIASIAVEGVATFTVAPKADLTEGNYAATVTVSGTNLTSKSFGVTFEVNPAAPVYDIEDIAPYSYTQPLGAGSTFPTFWTNSTNEEQLTFYLKFGTDIQNLMDQSGQLAQDFVERRYVTGVRLETGTATATQRMFCFGKWGLNSPGDNTQWVFSEFVNTTTITNSTVSFDQQHFMQQLMAREAGMVVVVKSRTEYDFYVDRGDDKFVWVFTYNSTWTNPLQRLGLIVAANSSTSGSSRNNFCFDRTTTFFVEGQVCLGVADPKVFVEVDE